MIQQIEFQLPRLPRGVHLVTDHILTQLPKLPQQGLLHLLIKHTSAGLNLNENWDPSVRADMHHFVNELVPENHPLYTHIYEGADDMPAHIKAVLVGQEVTIPITQSKLNLGTWQGIYYFEFRDNPTSRFVVATMYC